jgi:hypothetical protein
MPLFDSNDFRSRESIQSWNEVNHHMQERADQRSLDIHKFSGALHCLRDDTINA